MNVFGKTLVVCNMVVAIAAAALFVLVHYRSTNWKEGFDEAQAELITRTTSSKVSKEVASETSVKLNSQISQTNAAGLLLLTEEEKHKAEMRARDLKIDDADRKTAAAELSRDKTNAENQRLKLENQAVQKNLQISEQAKLDQQTVANDLFKKLEDVKNERDRLQIRNENLVELMRQKDKLLQELSTRGGGNLAGGAPVPANIVRGPNEPNPPTTKVKGIIERIDRKPGDAGGVLLQLSVGIDHGVNSNNTLEVYRTEPRPEYLGTIRIINSYPARSIGRLMRASSASPLREGDIVVDSIGSP